jgi:hypothetical protein
VNKVIVVILGLLAAIHVGIPAMYLPAPAPVFLAFAGVIWTLVFMIAGPLRRDGLFPVWLRVTA